ncbi:hypothetical protein B0H17DRAFT_128500 [Mycena rosella]|uniref:PAS domain-containing protein n=1 Tax=Mycena rosella TaxID=1033263 RepID=A0AAD7G7U4_MYCRO|nr:hypothetical protein B0H17DRAFT_128500 [Mycena rosella]
MSFEYLQQSWQQHPGGDGDGGGGGDDGHSGLQFQMPGYLYDVPPTLAPGGGAEALHPAFAAQWFANSGFKRQQYQYQEEQQDDLGYVQDLGLMGNFVFPAVQDAYSSLESLHAHFPHATPPPLLAAAAIAGLDPSPSPSSTHSLSPSPRSPPPLALPVYSQSGFDVVSLLARVQNRRDPHVRLGPIDFTTSFVVVDVRRHDDPIVYCSPSFCALTGYHERAVLGRNCRFLQAPPIAASAGNNTAPALSKGDPRRHTSPAAVRALAKAVSGRKEAQASVVNYRADGTAFVNLVSVVPLCGEHADDPAAEVVWFVGFQIDLTVQSAGIVERVREGRYYAGAVMREQEEVRAGPEDARAGPAKTQKALEGPTREKRAQPVAAPRMAPALARLLTHHAFLASCNIHPRSPRAVAFPPTPRPTRSTRFCSRSSPTLYTCSVSRARSCTSRRR